MTSVLDRWRSSMAMRAFPVRCTQAPNFKCKGLVGRCHQPGRRADSGADVAHFVRARLVGRIEVRVVVAIGEMPVEHGRHCRRCRTPCDRCRLRRDWSSRPIWSSPRRAHIARWRSLIRSPFSCSAFTLPRPHSLCGSHGRFPDRARIGPALDEKSAAGLRHVLAGHVHARTCTGLLALSAMILEPPPAAADLVQKEKRERPPGGGILPLAIAVGSARPFPRASRRRWRCRSRRVPGRGRRGRRARRARCVPGSRRPASARACSRTCSLS